MQEQRLETELGTIPTREQSLAVGLAELEEGRTNVLQRESVLWEWERRLSEKELLVSSREAALADREREVSSREEAMLAFLSVITRSG